MSRRSLASLGRGSAVLATALGCQRILGFQHGVPAPAECDVCPEGGTTAGEPAQGGQGGAPRAGSGGTIAGGGARSDLAGAAGSGVGGSEAGATAVAGDAAGGAGASGGSSGGSVTAGSRAGGTGGKSNGAGRGGAAECASDECPNPDEEHCLARCMPQGEALACGVTPLDRDGDEYGDARCVVPGEDCDDANPKIAPGVTELCDGIDNDCDGKRDLENGLSLSGPEHTLDGLAGTELVPAYAPETGRFLLSWRPAPSVHPEPGIAYAVLDLEANPIGTGFVPSDDGDVQDFSVAAGGGAFAIFWSNAAGAHFQRISSEGALASSTVVTSYDYVPGLAVAYASPGGWTTFWEEDNELLARRVGDGDVLGPVAFVSEVVDNAPMQAMASGEAILLIWRFSNRNIASLLPYTLVGGRDLELGFGNNGAPIYGATFAARPEGFGVVGIRQDVLVFEVFDPDGTRRCGPVVLQENPFYFDVAPSENGFVVVGDDAIEDFDLDCRAQQHARSPAVLLPGAPRLVSAGPNGFLATWQNFHTFPTILGFRRFGPHFCD